MNHKPEKPRAPDHYGALGIMRSAAATAIKTVFHKLALKRHPDKLAPGGTADAADFCKIREAYETLIDVEKRMLYDFQHPNIQQQWQKYHRDHDAWEHRAAAEAAAEAERARARAAAEAERARRQKEVERREWIWTMGKNEEARRDFHEHEDNLHRMWGCGDCCGICKQRNDRLDYQARAGIYFPRPVEYVEYLQMKVEEAQRVAQAEQAAQAHRTAQAEQAARAQEAAQAAWTEQAEHRSHKKWCKRQNKQRKAQDRQRAEQEKAARVRKAQDERRAANIRAKEQRSNEAASHARAHQQIAAQIRMARQHVKEQQEKYLASHDVVTEACLIDIGWTKVKGLSQCVFCDEAIVAFSFKCPDGGAIACLACKTNLCRFTPAKDEHVDENMNEYTEVKNERKASGDTEASQEAAKEGGVKAEETQGAWKPYDEWFRVEQTAEDSDDMGTGDDTSDQDMDP